MLVIDEGEASSIYLYKELGQGRLRSRGRFGIRRNKLLQGTGRGYILSDKSNRSTSDGRLSSAEIEPQQ